MKDCDPKFLKNLKEGMLYKFYQNYKYFVDDKTELTLENYELYNDKPISSVDFAGEEVDLYSSHDLNINVSAIVGKNGSGKSSLMELLFLAKYIISENRNILIPNIEGLEKRVKEIDHKNSELKNVEDVNLKQNLKDQITFIEKLREKVSIELFYQINNETLIFINIEKGEINLAKSSKQSGNSSFSLSSFDFSEYFYTIAINYSLYGLNELDNFWLGSLLHKNDGYKTPIVINPMRTNGNIDVNNELHLAQTRTLLNLSSRNENNPEIVNNKKISKVNFVIDLENNNSIYLSWRVSLKFKDVMRNHHKYYNENVLDIFNKISIKIGGLLLDRSSQNKLLKESTLQPAVELSDSSGSTKKSPVRPIRVKYEMIKYAVRKLFKICIQYPDEYGEFIEKGISPSPILKMKDIDGLLEKVSLDKSHLTLKLRQIVYSIFSDYLFEEGKWAKQENENMKYEIEFEWKDLSDNITKAEEDFDKYLNERMEVVPAAFLKPKLMVGNVNNEPHEYQGLSSGEQQLANVIQTVTYHLYNLNSVHYASNSASRLCYKSINIIFDEVELYFHPEFQRKFIDGLLKSIDQMNLKDTKGKGVKAINIQFLTHSPFILSDIPSSNILRLEDGKPKPKTEQTFAANIHDLLASDFFLENTIGEFSTIQMNSIIDLYNRTSLLKSEDKIKYEKLKEEFRSKKVKFKYIIINVGEKVIKRILENHFSFMEQHFMEK